MKTRSLPERLAELYKESIDSIPLTNWVWDTFEGFNRLLVGIEEKVQISVWISISALIVSLIGNSLVQDQRDTIKDFRSKLDSHPTKFRTALSEKDDAIRDLFQRAGPGPVVLISPPNMTSLVTNHVSLTWNDRKTYHDQDYRVQVVLPNGNVETFFPTNSLEQSTSFPSDKQKSLHDPEYGPGLYLWRVMKDAGWSGYYAFKIYTSHVERIRNTGIVRVGIHSDGVFGDKRERSYVGRNPQSGYPEGPDANRAKSIVSELQKTYSVRINEAQFIEYDTIDSLLEDGVLSGGVDFGIGAITRTKYREGKGIVFTKIYKRAAVVAIALKDKESIADGDKVGFVKGTIYRKVAQSIANHAAIVQIEENSYGEMRARLGSGELDVILMDEPRVNFDDDTLVSAIPGENFRPFEISEFGYAAGYAIATKDQAFCQKLDELLTVEKEAHSVETMAPLNPKEFASCVVAQRQKTGSSIISLIHSLDILTLGTESWVSIFR